LTLGACDLSDLLPRGLDQFVPDLGLLQPEPSQAGASQAADEENGEAGFEFHAF
jgi:hypothetical protein